MDSNPSGAKARQGHIVYNPMCGGQVGEVGGALAKRWLQYNGRSATTGGSRSLKPRGGGPTQLNELGKMPPGRWQLPQPQGYQPGDSGEGKSVSGKGNSINSQNKGLEKTENKMGVQPGMGGRGEGGRWWGGTEGKLGPASQGLGGHAVSS